MTIRDAAAIAVEAASLVSMAIAVIYSYRRRNDDEQTPEAQLDTPGRTTNYPADDDRPG